jgi:hypothetical protein
MLSFSITSFRVFLKFVLWVLKVRPTTHSCPPRQALALEHDGLALVAYSFARGLATADA